MDSNLFGLSNRDKENNRIPYATNVKNKQPAEKQITAEQILREAQSIQTETEYRPPKQLFSDSRELSDYRLAKRKEFEELVRRMGWDLKIWLKYAHWEEQQRDFRRARSVYERAIDADYRSVQVWLRYTEMEMKNKFINHARNIWDRAVNTLPLIDQFWYKYAHMEEMLGNIPGAQHVLERWMKYKPDHKGWNTFINFEIRYGNFDHARAIYEQYVQCHSITISWSDYAKFEMKYGEVHRVREIFKRAIEKLEPQQRTSMFFNEFAKFETTCHEYERARIIYKYALNHIPRSQVESFLAQYVTFEKQHGDTKTVESVINNQRRFEYEKEVQSNPFSYDAWFNYIWLEESEGCVQKIRAIYTRALNTIPPPSAKKFWYRYVYLWINYALFEELETNDLEKSHHIYHSVLQLIPHKKFTFSKVWILAAQLEIRRGNLQGARLLFGQGLGIHPKTKIFEKYIEIEFYIGNMDRCRAIYEKLIEFCPTNTRAWMNYANLEIILEEPTRARGIFELAVGQSCLDMPERMWKSYIDFEIRLMNRERARELYERLLEKTTQVKVWLGYAEFELCPLQAILLKTEATTDKIQESFVINERVAQESPELRKTLARAVYDRAYAVMRKESLNDKEAAVILLEAWRDFEKSVIDPEENQTDLLDEILKKMPRKIRRKRILFSDDGRELGTEEYWDYVFPEDEESPGLNLLAAAYTWKTKLGNRKRQC